MSKRVFRQIRAGLEEALEYARTVHRCSACDRLLSVAEFVGRKCEGCGSSDDPFATKEKLS